MRTVRYRAVPPKIDRRWSISAVGGRLKKKSTVGGRLRKKKEKRRGKEKKKKRGEERIPRPRAVAARGLPAPTAAFSPTRGDATTRGLPAPAAAFSSTRGDGASPCAGRKIEAMSPRRLFSFILRTSYIGNLSLFFDMEKKLKQGHNIVLFSNHQTEADPPLIALLLEKTNPYLAEKLVRLVVVSFSVVSVLVVFKCYVLYLRFLWQETGLLPTHFASPSAWAGSCHFF
ncbi:hypothetical protein GW17_00002884 [Ensete ventricosum]|nr:hypothetical protein GW17_00002884 [Ensete ventricosum]